MAQGERSGRSERTVDPQLLKMALAPHPKLRAALFPAVPRGNGPPSDISVYHLLQVNTHPSPAGSLVFTSLLSFFSRPVGVSFQSLHPLDPSRLFGWQAANTLNSTGKP